MHMTKFLISFFLFTSIANASGPHPTIEELEKRPFLDDFYSNVLFGHKLVMDTPKHAKRYVGNRMKCVNCHLGAGTQKDALPLNVAGIYPQWRSKNGRRNGIELRIRECFYYSMNGIMPSNDAPEVQAISSYIHYLSAGEKIGVAPVGRGFPRLPATGFDPNPALGRVVYQKHCLECHKNNGQGDEENPPLWGPDSYNAGAGMNNIQKSAGFIWANMPYENGKTLTHQEALNVAAFINQQLRPPDPRKGKLRLLLSKLLPKSLFDMLGSE
jgi:thiosulfate dehydrogenase